MEFFKESDCDVADGEITLSKANRLLRERGKILYGHIDPNMNSEWSAALSSETVSERERYWCYQALLINVEPIPSPDTAESLLKAFANWKEWDGMTGESSKKPTLFELQKRAQALIGKGEE